MYTGDNPTAIQSIEGLKNALISLMEQKPYKTITIKDLCDKANLSRQTFYNFFEGKEDIIHYYLRKYLGTIWSENPDTKQRDLSKEIGSRYFHIFETNRRFFEIIIAHELDSILYDEVAEIIKRRLQREPEFSDPNIYAYQIAFLTGGMTSMIIHWMKDTEKLSVNAFENIMRDMFNGKFVNTVSKNKRIR